MKYFLTLKNYFTSSILTIMNNAIIITVNLVNKLTFPGFRASYWCLKACNSNSQDANAFFRSNAKARSERNSLKCLQIASVGVGAISKNIITF